MEGEPVKEWLSVLFLNYGDYPFITSEMCNKAKADRSVLKR